jgi:hypothetical protein
MARDPRVLPASYTTAATDLTPIFRGQAPDAQPLPVGSPTRTTSTSRRPIASTTSFASDDAPEPLPAPNLVVPPPTPVPSATAAAPLRPIPEGAIVPGTGCLDECGTCCPDVCCPECCGPNGTRFYVSAEYLLWWLQGAKLPPLVTTSPATSLGVIGQPGTTVLFGESEATNTLRSGVRGTIGWWLDPEQTWALEGTALFLGRQSHNFGASSMGTPLLARPFFNVLANAEDAELVANPLVPTLPGLLPLAGSVTVGTSSRLWGAQADLVRNLYRGPCFQWDVFGGFRYLDLMETLDINESLMVPLTSPAAAGTTFLVSDGFHTRNQFYGGELGTRTEFKWGDWFLNLRGSVAVGNTHQTADIVGLTTVGVPGTPAQTFAGGLLAQPTNGGRYTNNVFSVVPEVGLNIGYQLTDYARIFVGYSFLYWTNVARPGQQVDLGVNPSLIAPPRMLMGPARPAFFFRDADVFVQGINFGLELRY